MDAGLDYSLYGNKTSRPSLNNTIEREIPTACSWKIYIKQNQVVEEMPFPLVVEGDVQIIK